MDGPHTAFVPTLKSQLNNLGAKAAPLVIWMNCNAAQCHLHPLQSRQADRRYPAVHRPHRCRSSDPVHDWYGRLDHPTSITDGGIFL